MCYATLSTGLLRFTRILCMCRLRTSSLPQPSRTARFCFTAPAVSLRASAAIQFILCCAQHILLCIVCGLALLLFPCTASTFVIASAAQQSSKKNACAIRRAPIIYYLCSNKKRAGGAFFIQPRLMPRWSARLPNQQESGHMLLLR